jgi:SnoaL-like domain
MNERQENSRILEEIIDHHEIRKILSTYCHGCDRGDAPRMASVYAEDSWDDHGQYKGPGRAFATHVIKSTVDHDLRVNHLLGQSQIKVIGTDAGAETYFIATLFEKDDQGKELMTLLGGRYVDTLVRGAGGWQIKHRICIRDWSRTLSDTTDRLADDNFVKGLLSGDDPSYAVLGLTHPGMPEKHS